MVKTEDTCEGCSELECMVRKQCPDNELENKQDVKKA